METLIPADQTFLLWAFIFGVVGLALWIESLPSRVRQYGVIGTIVIGALASNLRIVPGLW